MLTSDSRRALRARAHVLKPVVIVGQRGLTPTVLGSISEALEAHELIKVKLPAIQREERAQQAELIASELHADIVASVGRTVIFHRKRSQPTTT